MNKIKQNRLYLTNIAIAFHPGETLQEKLEEIGMSVKEFAIRTTKPQKTIIAVIKGKSSITPEMAVSFENVTLIPAHFWLNKQRSYDEYVVRLNREKEATKHSGWLSKFPLKEMTSLGWLSSPKNIVEKINTIYKYYGVSSEKAWHKFYMQQELKVAFNLSLEYLQDPYAMSAWLRQGEIQSMEITVENKYSTKNLKDAIPEMRRIMIESEDDFFSKLQTLCASIGIKLVSTDCLSKAPIQGATRWFHGTPLIQLSKHFKRYDLFWFTFFHEIGHILLHGKKDFFLEDKKSKALSQAKELEADEFAKSIIFSELSKDEIQTIKDFTPKYAIEAASKFKITLL